MLDASLRAGLIEVLSGSFNSDELAEIGALVLRKFDLYKLTNRHRHVTVPVRDAAQAVVEACEDKKRTADLIQLVVETDGALLMGRRVTVRDLEIFLADLARAGHTYDFDRRRLREITGERGERPNWGALRDGREYEVSVASVDIVGSSSLVKRAGQRIMERVYYQFWEFVRSHLSRYDGRIWSWAGDGGLVAFAMKDDAVRAAQWALEVQATMPIFNARPDNPLDEPISVRIGMDRGTVRFLNDTGRITSAAINFAVHLEKDATEPGSVCISEHLVEYLPADLRGLFATGGEFDGRDVFTLPARADGWAASRRPVAQSG